MKKSLLLFLMTLMGIYSYGQVRTYSYDFADESVITTDDQTAWTSTDGIVSISQGTGGTFKNHASGHGAVFSNGNTFSISVSSKSTISFGLCVYSAVGATLEFTDENGTSLGSIEATLKIDDSTTSGEDGDTRTFEYEGDAQVITATLVATGSVYIHNLSVNNQEALSIDDIVGEYSYDFADESVITTDDQSSWTSTDGIVSISQGTGGTFKNHANGHGAVFSNGNTFSINVSSKSTISFGLCVYSAVGATLEFTDENGTSLGSIEATLKIDDSTTSGEDGDTRTFEYEGDAQVITATLVASGSVYIHNLSVNNQEVISIDDIVGEYSYDFADESVITTDDQSSWTSTDGIVTILQGTGGTFKNHASGHGAVFSNGNTFNITVAPKSNIKFGLCLYSATGATLEFTDASGESLGTIDASLKGVDGATDGETRLFEYKGEAQVITATLVASGSVYIHGLSINNEDALESLDGKTQVWDFGAEQFTDENIINMLDVATINAWYDASITAGSTGPTLPNFTADVLSWTGDPLKDRLRSSNTELTRYDTKSSGEYTGYVYANGTVTVTDGLPNKRYFTIQLDQDDEVSVVDMGNNGAANVTFVYKDDVTVQNEYLEAAQGTPTQVDFIAKKDGSYLIFDAADKLSVFRITRKNADFVTVSGSVDESDVTTDISGYGILFTNSVTGKEWIAEVSEATYSIDIPAGHTYDVALSGANGVVVANTSTLDLTEATTLDIVLDQVDLNSVTGSIDGLGDQINNLTLVYEPAWEEKIYVPEVTIDTENSTYTVVLEPNCEYIITAEGVNDYAIGASSITVTADSESDIFFTPKTTYEITLTGEGLPTEISSQLSCVFTNLNEEGYEYTFAADETVMLRDGTYDVKAAVSHEYAYEQDLTSNLVVDGGVTSKTISFSEVTKWIFTDEVISNATAYKGLAFTGSVNVRGGNGDLNASAGTDEDPTTVIIPVKEGQKVMITHYYLANFKFESEDAILNETQSTGTKITDEYMYTGAGDGTVTVTILGTTYFTAIEVVDVIDYVATITVGADKEYQTINDALDAIAKMDRVDSEGNIQRVTVMIDPDDYEEMLVIDQDNVSFTNAATSPSIALKDAGVNINENAVRITSYYGHGYNYYSQSNQKWDADALRVNKENGYISYENQGGTTNGSYWNATVVVSADGFIADNIIFENSFNQYISKKESEDVVVEWTSGGKGTRPTTEGSTEVQAKSFIERAAALALTGDKMFLNNCMLVGHQDVFYGAQNSRAAIFKGNMMGSTDYIFGGMTAVFYKTDLAMNTSEDNNDVTYITAGQQAADARGYLMYQCNVTSAEPGVDNAATYRSKPGYWGRCWSGSSCEVIFYKTTIETSNNPDYSGLSLIAPEGWNNGLGGPSWRVGEYGTVEVSVVDNSSNRLSGAEEAGDWGQTVLSSATTRQPDQVELTAFNFTKGSDDWDPLTEMIAADQATAIPVQMVGELKVYQNVPNPASVSTQIRYNLEESEDVTLTIYNSMGGVVKVINEGTQVAGEQVINVNLSGMSSGMYFYSLRAGENVITKKMIVK